LFSDWSHSYFNTQSERAITRIPVGGPDTRALIRHLTYCIKQSEGAVTCIPIAGQDTRSLIRHRLIATTNQEELAPVFLLSVRILML
jgi:hypothetical protein